MRLQGLSLLFCSFNVVIDDAPYEGGQRHVLVICHVLPLSLLIRRLANSRNNVLGILARPTPHRNDCTEVAGMRRKLPESACPDLLAGLWTESHAEYFVESSSLLTSFASLRISAACSRLALSADAPLSMALNS